MRFNKLIDKLKPFTHDPNDIKSVRSLLSKICGEKSVEECERAVDEWIRKVGKAAAPAEAKKESEKAAAATEAKKEAEKAAAATKATVRLSP